MLSETPKNVQLCDQKQHRTGGHYGHLRHNPEAYKLQMVLSQESRTDSSSIKPMAVQNAWQIPETTTTISTTQGTTVYHDNSANTLSKSPRDDDEFDDHALVRRYTEDLDNERIVLEL